MGALSQDRSCLQVRIIQGNENEVLEHRQLLAKSIQPRLVDFCDEVLKVCSAS
jgi:hypothetical protein